LAKAIPAFGVYSLIKPLEIYKKDLRKSKNRERKNENNISYKKQFEADMYRA
jgi:hypothetical protein